MRFHARSLLTSDSHICISILFLSRFHFGAKASMISFLSPVGVGLYLFSAHLWYGECVCASVRVCVCLCGRSNSWFSPGVLPTVFTTSSSLTLISFLLAESQPIRAQQHKGSGQCQCNHKETGSQENSKKSFCHFHSYNLTPIQQWNMLPQHSRYRFTMSPLLLVGIGLQFFLIDC